MTGHDIIVVGASAGGVEALTNLVRGLPGDLPAAVFAVLHIPAEAHSLLPDILSRAGPLPAEHPADGDKIEHGRIYVAPPDRHLLVEHGRVRVARGPRENRHRPAVDPLFRSAAIAYGPRVVGVILTGTLDDGTAGLRVVKQRGGKAVVQDAREALYHGMPRSAIENVEVDHVLPLAGIPPMLERLAHEPAGDESRYPVSDVIAIEAKMAEMETNDIENLRKLEARPSSYSCPECHGTLWELQDGELLRFRCQVGHAYTADSMLADHSDALERALWASLRALEERSELMSRLAARAREHQHRHSSRHFDRVVKETAQHIALIRQVLESYDSQDLIEDLGSQLVTRKA